MLATAALFRFWQLGQAPPGLYRDEAYNGLDAVGVLEGRNALFFVANNGREPAYIYGTALSILALGRTPLAVRLTAAVAGTLTTLITYQLGKLWFGRGVALAAAWLWAVTLWPVHLSRIGFRPILLVPALALAFAFGTVAYRKGQWWRWLLAGMAYGAAFYTYLAIRWTPLLLAVIPALLALGRPARQRLARLWPGAAWFGLGWLLVAGPLLWLALRQPALVLGRAGQVSILQAAVNGGDLWGTFWRHVGQALGLFLWRGDRILRHNPPGRPLFDPLMAVPFLVGLAWCLRHWRRPPAATTLLWSAAMLGPTILAEDTPHFLRAVGILPATLFFPAIGLVQLWRWPRWPRTVGRSVLLLLAAGSAGLTVRDYRVYNVQPDTAYLFEAAARDLAGDMNQAGKERAIWADKRFFDGWPSLTFLLDPALPVTRFQAETGLELNGVARRVIYAWPHEPRDFILAALPLPAMVSAESGSLARGDLEPSAYPLYVRYESGPAPSWGPLARFGPPQSAIELLRADLTLPAPQQIQVDLAWEAASAPLPELVAFVHVVGPDGLVGQDDAVPGQGQLPASQWRPGLVVQDAHRVTLPVPFVPQEMQVLIGLYPAATLERLPAFTPEGLPAGDSWPVGHNPVGHNPVGHNPVGHSPVGHSPVGHSPVGHNPVGHNQ